MSFYVYLHIGKQTHRESHIIKKNIYFWFILAACALPMNELAFAPFEHHTINKNNKKLIITTEAANAQHDIKCYVTNMPSCVRWFSIEISITCTCCTIDWHLSVCKCKQKFFLGREARAHYARPVNLRQCKLNLKKQIIWQAGSQIQQQNTKLEK